MGVYTSPMGYRCLALTIIFFDLPNQTHDLLLSVNIGLWRLRWHQNGRSDFHSKKHLEFTPPKTNECPLKINGWKMYFLLKWSLSKGHVSFQGCKPVGVSDDCFSTCQVRVGRLYVSWNVMVGITRSKVILPPRFAGKNFSELTFAEDSRNLHQLWSFW